MIEENFWKQKVRVEWLDVGEKNTKYFHSLVKQRRIKSVIHKIQVEGRNWLTEEEDIATETVRYFSSLFIKDQSYVNSNNFESIIPKLVTSQENEKLENILSFE